jgi:hypothetical protein
VVAYHSSWQLHRCHIHSGTPPFASVCVLRATTSMASVLLAAGAGGGGGGGRHAQAVAPRPLLRAPGHRTAAGGAGQPVQRLRHRPPGSLQLPAAAVAAADRRPGAGRGRGKLRRMQQLVQVVRGCIVPVTHSVIRLVARGLTPRGHHAARPTGVLYAAVYVCHARVNPGSQVNEATHKVGAQSAPQQLQCAP